MDTRKKALLKALEQSLGVVTPAVKKAGLSRSVHYKWMNEDPEYKKAVEGLKDVAIDFAESKLHQQINDGNTTATIFFLKTQGKNRGYVERHEHVVDEQPIFTGIDLSLDKYKMKDDE